MRLRNIETGNSIRNTRHTIRGFVRRGLQMHYFLPVSLADFTSIDKLLVATKKEDEG